MVNISTHLLRFVLAIVFLTSLAFPATGQPEIQLADLGECPLENGAVIQDCRLGYRTFGELDAEKSNAILFTTWFTGTTEDLIGLIGPGKLIDSSRYFVIAVDAFGDGVSSSPSNSKKQPGETFPLFTIRDMVKAQYRLLNQVLHIPHLRAVTGISMGGMQTFEWMVSYPEFLDQAVPIVGSPRLTSYDLLLWQAQLELLENADGRPGSQQAAQRAVAAIIVLTLDTPRYRATQTAPEDVREFFTSFESNFWKNNDVNDYMSQLRAMIAHDVSAPFSGSLPAAAGAVRAQALVVAATQDHMVNPLPALEFARLLKAEILELSSDCGHVTFQCETNEIAAAIDLFLQR